MIPTNSRVAPAADPILDEFTAAWTAHLHDRSVTRPDLTRFLERTPEDERLRPELVRLDIEYNYRADANLTLLAQDYFDRFNQLPRARIIDLVVEHFERVKAKIKAEEYCRQFPDFEVELRQRIDCLPQIDGYEIIRELGRGGMGVVYYARQVKANRHVALKLVQTGNAAAMQRFRTEAEAVARLQHPHVVQVFEVGDHEGQPFFSMEFVDGGSLSEQIAKELSTPDDAAVLVEKLARAMHHAHERQIIHRDLKPGNILIAKDGTPKIADFGLAKQLDDASGETKTGAVIGTPSYMRSRHSERCKKFGLAFIYGQNSTLEIAGGTLEFVLDLLQTGGTTYLNGGNLKVSGNVGYNILGGTLKGGGTITANLVNNESCHSHLMNALAAAHLLMHFPNSGEASQLHCRRLARITTEGKEPNAKYHVTLFNGETGQRIAGPFTHAMPIVQVALGRDGKTLAVVAAILPDTFGRQKVRRASLLVWDVPSGQSIAERDDLVDPPSSMSVGSRSRAVAMVKPSRVELVRVDPVKSLILRHARQVTSVAFSSDERFVVTSSADRSARIWNVDTGEPIGLPLEHRAQVTFAAISPCNRYVATCSADNTARVWNTRAGEPVTPWLLHPGEVVHASFSSDSKRLITASHAGSACVWQVIAEENRPPADIVRLAEILSTSRLQPQGGLAPLKPNEYVETWRAVEKKSND